MELPKYWFIKNDYKEVRDYLADTYKEEEIRDWGHEYIGWDGSTYYSGCHGFREKGWVKNNAEEIFIHRFRAMTNPNMEPNYEIY